MNNTFINAIKRCLEVIPLILGCVLVFLMIPAAYAHPGNTDKYGCHTCRTNCPSWGLNYGQYHCHTPKVPAYTPPSSNPVIPSNSFKYLWKSQSGTVSSDGTAHEIHASPGDTVAMSVTLVNRSGRTIQGLSALTPVTGKVNYGGWGLGTSKPIDNKPTWLDPSSFVINGNRFVYYNGSDVSDGAEFTIAWNVKISTSAKKSTYNLYLNCVKEWENWTQQVSASGILLKSPDIFWRFIIS